MIALNHITEILFRSEFLIKISLKIAIKDIKIEFLKHFKFPKIVKH